MSPHTATTPIRQLSLQRVSANQKSRSFISPNNSNYAQDNEVQQSPIINQNAVIPQIYNQRDASIGTSNTGVHKLLFMKSEESVPAQGWPNILNQKQSTISSSKMVHFQSSPGQHKSTQQVKPFKKKDLKELLIGPSHLKQIHNGPMAPQKQYLQTDGSEDDKNGLTMSMQRPKIVPKLKLNDLMMTQNTTMKNSPNRPMNNTMNKLQIGSLMQSQTNENASLYRPSQQAAVTERDETMRIKELNSSGQNGLMLQGSTVNWSKHLHGPRIDNNLNQYRRNMLEKEGEISQTSSFGRSSRSDLTAQSNRTQEKDFTPGQHQQFKSFLKSQTVDRDDGTDDKLLNSLLGSQATVAQENGTAGSTFKLSEPAIQLKKNLNMQIQNKSHKQRIRAQTRQVQSKQDDDLAELKGGAAEGEVAVSVMPLNKKEQKRRQNIRHIKQNSHMNISNRMSPTPQPIPIEIFSHTESDGNNSSHRYENNDIAQHLQSNQRLKYRGGQKKFIMSKFTLNHPPSVAQKQRDVEITIVNNKDPKSFKKRQQAVPGVKSDSMKSINDSNANYDSSPQLTEQKSVRQMLLHTHEKERTDGSDDDQIVDFIDEEGHRFDPIGNNLFGQRQTQPVDDQTDSANLSNLNASVNEMEANDFHIDENTQNLSGIFQQIAKNKIQPNRTLMQGHMMPKSVVDDRVDSNQKSQGGGVEHHQLVSPLNGNSASATGFDLSEFGKLIMSQLNPFSLPNQGHGPSESMISQEITDNGGLAQHLNHQYHIQDYQTTASVQIQQRQTAPPTYQISDEAHKRGMIPVAESFNKKKPRSRYGNESLKKRKSYLNVDDSMEMNDEESQKIKQMMLDTERRKVLQKKGVSHKNPVASHKDLDKKTKRHKEVIKTDDGPSNQKSRTGKKGNLQIRKTDYDITAQLHHNKHEQKPQMAKQIKSYYNQHNKRLRAQDDVNMGEYMKNRVGDAIESGQDAEYMDNRIGDMVEPGLSGEHREDLQMQIKQQFSARKQYFNGNGPMPTFIDKQASADPDDRLAVSVEVKAIQKSLKNQSLKSGAKSQSSLNEEDRGKSLTTQFMNMFAFGAYQQPKRASKKEIDMRKSQDIMKKSKHSSKNLKSSFLGTNKDDLHHPGKIAMSKQERGHKTLSLQTGIVDNQKSSKCYSPKFHKPQLVKPPSQNNTSKESTNRVTPINLSQKSKFNLFHPRTTKNTDLTNREENVVGEIANVKVFGGAMVGLRGDLASVRSSQMLVLRSNQKGTTSDKKSDIKNNGNGTMVKSARGHTEERRGNLILNELSKNKKMNTISGQSNSESPEEDGLSTREKGRQKQLHYRGLNKPMSTMMIMRNNLTNETKHTKKASGKNPKHFVFPTQQAQPPNTNHSSTINRTMNTQILSMMDNKSQKKSGRQHQQHQSFLSQQHDNNQEGSIIESARQHKAHENGSSANQPIIAHYQRHSFVEDQIAEQFDETNAYAFEMQQNESTSLSPIKNKNQEPFVDEIRTMVKKSKKKVTAALNQQKSAPRKEYSRTEGLSQCSLNTNSWQPPQASSSSNPLLPPLKSKSFNQHLAPSQPLPFPSHHLQSSHLSSIISHNIQSQHSNGQHLAQGGASQVSGANTKANAEKRSNSLSSERRLLHRDVEKKDRGHAGQQVKLATFTKVANALQQYHQHSSDRPPDKAKDGGNQSGDQISRNPTSSMLIEMQETIPLDRMHQDKTDITMDNQDDEGDLQEATIWNAGNKIQAGAWSKVSAQAHKNQSLLGAQRSAIGPKGTNIALSEAVRKHNRQTSKTTLDQEVKQVAGKDKAPRTTLKRKENENSSQSKKMARQQQIMLQDEQLRIEEDNALKTLPANGCGCNGEIGKQQKRGCVNAERWLKLSFKDQEWVHFNNYKLYQMHLKSQQMIKDDGGALMNIDNHMSPADNEQDIKLDVERTFQHLEYFQRTEIKESLTRILVTYSNYEASIGYVQGMNFVVAILLYHAGEVGAYFLLDQLMEKYQLKQVMQTGLPGLRAHEKKIEEIGREELPALFEHFDKHDVTISLFSTDWIMSMFLNFVPIEMSHIYLSLFFEKGWDIFYYVAIQILKYYNDKLLKLNDAGYIVGQIKQARVGCEHLLMLSSSQHSIQSSSKLLSQSFQEFSLRESVPVSSHMRKDQYKLHMMQEDTERQSKDHSDMSMPFGFTSPQVPDEQHPTGKHGRIKGIEPMIFDDQVDLDDEPFEKEAVSILDDSRSEIMTEHQNQSQFHHNQSSRPGQGLVSQNRSQSLMPQPKNISANDEPVLPNMDVKLGQNMQMSSGYRRNPMMKKNTKMWKQIIREVQKKFSTPQESKDAIQSQTAGANTTTPTISVQQ